VDAPFLTPQDLVRPWRRATVVASVVAAIELVLLLVLGALLVAKPLSHAIEKHAVATASRPAPIVAAPTKKVQAAIHRMHAPAGKARPRGHVRIMVLNGNGRSGAAGSAAGRLQHLGYKISGTANAHRQDYASSVVMYVPGYRAEGIRLGKDLHVKVVAPLDGVGRSALHGGQLVVIVGS
jgi:LytR cell envelope-related transcriptional attenuator